MQRKLCMRQNEHSAISTGHRNAAILRTTDDGRLRIDDGRFHEMSEG
ncbi:hypothetical protein [Bradyrhizobium sp. USDA 4454]